MRENEEGNTFVAEKGTFSLSQMSRTKLALALPWREKVG
jgi:hypothetical protein